jgi:predicted Zn-dependent protease
LLSITLLAGGRYDEAYRKFDELYTRLTPKQISEFAWRLNDMTWRMREPFAPITLWARALDLLAQTKRLDEFDAAIETVRLMCTSPEFETLAPARARAFTAGGNPEWALELLAEAPMELHETASYRLAHAEALAARGRTEHARAEYTELLSAPDLSPAIRKQAETALAAMSAQ